MQKYGWVQIRTLMPIGKMLVKKESKYIYKKRTKKINFIFFRCSSGFYDWSNFACGNFFFIKLHLTHVCKFTRCNFTWRLFNHVVYEGLRKKSVFPFFSSLFSWLSFLKIHGVFLLGLSSLKDSELKKSTLVG